MNRETTAYSGKDPVNATAQDGERVDRGRRRRLGANRSRDSHGFPVSAPLLRPLLDVWETAAMLCVSVRYVRALTARGAIPVVRLGRRTLVRRTDIEKIIEQGGFAAA